MSPRRGVAAGLWLAVALSAPSVRAAPTKPPLSVGESIYLHGVLGSGAALEAVRAGGGPGMRGADAACVSCHQRSGLGATHQDTGPASGTESSVIPPIAGRYLFHASGRGEPNVPYVDGMRLNRKPYTEATLARAIRAGLDSEGRPLNYLMPRFPLDAADMAALIAYLKSLDPLQVPGVSDRVLHFATIITPDADPTRRRAMLDVMEKYFAERNSRQMVPSRRLQASDRTQYSRTMFMVHRQWQLHVWALEGPAATWQAQLEAHLARQPVLAAISGLGGANWAPVHEFCERQALPCLFPNVEVPVEAKGDFYSLYFSRGVLLEAALIGDRLLDSPVQPPVRAVHQIYRAGDSGAAAARVLRGALERRGIEVHDHVLPAAERDLSTALRGSAGGDALVLWLRPQDIAALGAADAPPRVYMSGLMAGLEHAPLPANWRARTRMAYPFDLPQQRAARLRYALAWFAIRRIPVVEEQLQVDTYLACGLLSEALSHMVDTFVRPYLVEQLEGMVEHRVVTGYYPRLTLAQNQQFASKGGYIAQFAGTSGSQLVADTAWLTP